MDLIMHSQGKKVDGEGERNDILRQSGADSQHISDICSKWQIGKQTCIRTEAEENTMVAAEREQKAAMNVKGAAVRHNVAGNRQTNGKCRKAEYGFRNLTKKNGKRGCRTA